MRRRQLKVWIVITCLVASACGGNGGNDEAASTPSPSPEGPVTIEGSLSVVYVVTRGTCKGVYNTGTGRVGALFRSFQAELARDRIEKVQGRTIEIRDEDGNVVASPATGEDPKFYPSGDKTCLAATLYKAQVPRRQSYVFTVQAAAGAPPAVPFEDLEATGFECDLQLGRDFDLLEDSPCEDLGV